MTKEFYVIGDPIEQSLSPTIHSLWIEAAGFDARYRRLHVPAGEAELTLQTLLSEGVTGLNVTMPHKHVALKASRSASPMATLIGAANTLTAKADSGWHADNTDAPGLLTALGLAGVENVAAKTVLVIGAGGAARAVVRALHLAGSKLIILNRTPERAAEIANSLTGGSARTGGLIGIADETEAVDFVVNTSGAAYGGEPLELPPGRDRLFLDISYGKAVEPQLAAARHSGWRTEDGLGMLVAQAAESFQIWFEERPDLQSALRLCRAAVEARQ